MMTTDKNADALLDLLHTTRAMRRLKPDPVPDADLRRILEAGLSAPSAGNRQQWAFIVVRDAAIKAAVQTWYQRAFDEVVGPHYAASAPPPGVTVDAYARQHKAVAYLTRHFHEAPVWIVACLDSGSAAPNRGSGASIYPAVQNMLLAARALGLGATLTTRHLLHGSEVDAIFELPSGVHSYAIVPIGYPIGQFGPVGRGALEDVLHFDKWGAGGTL